MDILSVTARRVAAVVVAVLLPGILTFAQIAYEWVPVPMDSTWDEIKDPTATHIIEEYKPLLGGLDEIVGYSVDEYSKDRPESGLSNLAADVILSCAEKETGAPVDISMTNFGGIRTSLPKGAVRVYDIYSIFPFENTVVTFDIKGSDLRKFIANMVSRNKIEAFGNIRMVVDGKRIEKLLVNGAPIDDRRVYRFATINFLMDGGDGITLRDLAMNYQDSGILIREAIVDYFRSEFNSGPIELKKDGRVRIINNSKKDSRQR
ncbi:MAG: 5'-nucleotidase C-terminal domain-containing protein [Bacteroidales bacterium]|nr:5'-nucleotidase C-terminal domain-containing protein [Candidatus Cacconaster merdequi]